MLAIIKRILKSTHTLIIVFSAILVALLFYAFPPLWELGANSGKGVTISLADDISPAYREVINDFNKEYEGRIHVETINIPFSKFSTNQRKELFDRFFRTKSSQVDVFSVDEIWTAKFAKWCDPLDAYFPKSLKSKILPSALKSCYYDSTLVAIPLFVDVGLMYYRKDLIEKLPNAPVIENELSHSITWSEFEKLGMEFKSRPNPFYIFQADNYEGLMCSLDEMMAGLGYPLYARGSFQLQSRGAEEAVRKMVNLVQKYHLSPPAVTDLRETSSLNYCLKHNGIFLRGWPDIDETLRDAAARKGHGEKWAMAPVPHFSGHPAVSILGGWDLMISKYSLHKEAALTFIKFLIRKRIQEIMFEQGGYLPSNADVYADKNFVRKNPDLKFYIGLLNSGVHRPSLADYTRFSDMISYYVKLAISGKLSASAALADAAQSIKTYDIYR